MRLRYVIEVADDQNPYSDVTFEAGGWTEDEQIIAARCELDDAAIAILAPPIYVIVQRMEAAVRAQANGQAPDIPDFPEDIQWR